jgi:hypothetical protein
MGIPGWHTPDRCSIFVASVCLQVFMSLSACSLHFSIFEGRIKKVNMIFYIISFVIHRFAAWLVIRRLYIFCFSWLNIKYDIQGLPFLERKLAGGKLIVRNDLEIKIFEIGFTSNYNLPDRHYSIWKTVVEDGLYGSLF